MSARTSKIIPRVIADFLEATNGVHAPNDAQVILDAIREAIFSASPVPALNRSLGQIMRQHPSAITSLEAWLKSPKVTQCAKSSGCHWAWVKWCSACQNLVQGKKAHVAFDMNSPGRPASAGFGEYEDAAVVAESRGQYVSSEIATVSVLIRSDGSELDRRELQRHRKLIRSRGHSTQEITEQARLINLKYPKD
jgi:hypothetical protein